VIAACALFIAATWGGFLYGAREDRAQVVARVQNENGFVASAFEEHARRILQTADFTLLYMVAELEKHGELTASIREFGAMAVADQAAVQLAACDARGDVFYMAVPGKGPVNVADREHIKVHAASADVGLYIGRPVVTRSTGAWAFFLSRRYNRKDGSFGGVVSIGIDPFYFGKVYGNLRIGQDRVGILVGTDHLVRVRISRDEPFVGDDIGFSPVFREVAKRPVGSYALQTLRTPRARFASYRAMPDFPLIVIVSAVQGEVLAAWQAGVRRSALLAAVFSVLVVAFGALLLRARAETHRRAEEARTLHERLIHAQKLEAIGTLAGGVAHDFNNMLGVILGHVDFAKEEAGASGPLRESLDEIEKAALRSVNVTRQLLAFARKQAIAPRVLDLNEGVETILRMIRRLIGERIELRWTPGVDTWKVRFDRSQLDQLLANLATNARDAIVGDGTVTIATANATVDGPWCAAHPGATAGDYAVLTVADTGAGIRPEDLPNIFEPFFTTKEVGRGTGLGLATVYGIVRQSGGFVDVESEPGRGSTFRLYLPRAREAPADGAQGTLAPSAPPGGSETILVVEDELAELRLVQRMLESMGYRVIAHADPTEALRAVREAGGPLDLVITDVVMPRMDGRELRDALCGLRPALKCLFMSGYPANILARDGAPAERVDYLQKPFTREELGEKVRRILDARPT